MITADLRRAILAAAAPHLPPTSPSLFTAPSPDPLLLPGAGPGSYASSLPFRLARGSGPGRDPRAVAAGLAAILNEQPWIAAAEATGRGYLTVTVTQEALARLAARIARAGRACAASNALHGHTVPAPAEADLAAEPDWPSARAALTAQLTARLAAAAGATIIFSPERTVVPPSAPRSRSPAEPSASLPPVPGEPPASHSRSRAEPSVHLYPIPAHPAAPVPSSRPEAGPVAGATAYAGQDAVRFALARMPPRGAPPQAAVIARHVLENPAYAVRYAHAAAAAVLRWAAALGTGPAGPEEFRPRLLAESHELALLDGLSWLPERVAVAARRGRPDEFAGYLEGLAARTIETMSTTDFTKISSISSERLWLADAARTGLAAGLELLGVSAPRRM